MSIAVGVPKSIRVHLTNVTGLGATQLVKSLLPAMEQVEAFKLEELYVPDRGPLSNYQSSCKGVVSTPYRRHIPKAISRIFECTFLGNRFGGSSPLLVLGDLPIRCNSLQTVFVQTPHLSHRGHPRSAAALARSFISRMIFRYNIKRIASVIVQTQAMRSALLVTYPTLKERIHVVGQPPPSWLLESGLKRTGRKSKAGAPLSLFYPAVGYPHKNHRLLHGIRRRDQEAWPIESLTLTIPPNHNPNPQISWIECVGLLSPEKVLNFYSYSDGLIFLSTAESYGFPLIEAMWVGLPIICPDLAYARAICGDRAIYFDPDSPDSLRAGVAKLQLQLNAGWWPDWTEQLRGIPTGWHDIAATILKIAAEGKRWGCPVHS